ncbi:MAG: hypothetical protein ABI551_07180 [Polyangiaceae bacterium]
MTATMDPGTNSLLAGDGSGASVASLADMLIDGANRVGPRAYPQVATAALVLAVAATALMFRSQHGKRAAAIALVVALAAAVPGTAILLGGRQDGPTRVGAAAAKIDAFRARIESFGQAHGCAKIVDTSCVECDPIVRFALATTDTTCASPAAIHLGSDALETSCVEANGALTCGRVEPK